MGGPPQSAKPKRASFKVFPLIVPLLDPPTKEIPQRVFLIVFDLIVVAPSELATMEYPTFDSLFDSAVPEHISIPKPDVLFATVLPETTTEGQVAKILVAN